MSDLIGMMIKRIRRGRLETKYDHHPEGNASRYAGETGVTLNSAGTAGNCL